MNITYKLFCATSLVLLFFVAVSGCKKLDRPQLGDFPTDEVNLPPGDLRFFTPFDLQGDEFRFKVRDSISGNPAFFSGNPLSLIAGVKDSAIQGEAGNAILYLNANDFPRATSFTVAFWEKNTVPTGGQPQFVFSVPSKDYWHNSGMFLLVDHEAAGSTASQAVVKFAVEDHWFEFTPANGRMPGNLLDNNWHHLAFVYDETTSKMSYFVDGQQLTGLPSALTDFLDSGVPHGPISLDPNSVSRFVLGGWNKHVGLAGPTDDWIQSWLGGLDQFRLYNKALSATEIQTLYNSRQ
jgi:hypothetical protein